MKTKVRVKPKPSPRFDFDCAVVGGGPGGLATALYLLRFKRKVALFEAGVPRVNWAPKIHNFLGHPEGVAGKSLLHDFKEQLRGYPEFKHIERRVTVSRLYKGFLLVDEKGKHYRAKKVVLATGVTDVQPKIENLNRLRRDGYLRYCSICDGYEMSSQPVAVLAKDDEGLKKALFICTWTPELKVFIPSDFHPSPRTLSDLKNCGVELVRSDQMGIREDRKKGGVWIDYGEDPYFATVVYVELGAMVNASAFRQIRSLRRTTENYLIASSEQRTSVPGLYAVGDCVNRLGQVSVALGQAAVAATNIHNELL